MCNDIVTSPNPAVTKCMHLFMLGMFPNVSAPTIEEEEEEEEEEEFLTWHAGHDNKFHMANPKCAWT
jgi:hypothetical protein